MALPAEDATTLPPGLVEYELTEAGRRALGRALRKHARREGLPTAVVARRAGLTSATIFNAYRGRVTTRTFERIAGALRVTIPAALLEDAGTPGRGPR